MSKNLGQQPRLILAITRSMQYIVTPWSCFMESIWVERSWSIENLIGSQRQKFGKLEVMLHCFGLASICFNATKRGRKHTNTYTQTNSLSQTHTHKHIHIHTDTQGKKQNTQQSNLDLVTAYSKNTRTPLHASFINMQMVVNLNVLLKLSLTGQ